jgi:lysophospholipase L1-like esterase
MKRRTACLVAAVALAVSAIGVAAPATAADDAEYVALGDSVASGNGILPYLDASCMHSDGTTKPALRSKRSYPMLLASSLGMSVVSEACSEYDTQEVGVQAAQLGNLGPATELVTLTVGVNNVNWPIEFDPGQDTSPDWGDALGACSSAVNDLQTCQGAIFLSLNSVADLPQRVAALVIAIRTAAPSAQILVTGYPLVFGQFAEKCSVGGGISFAPAQAQLVNQAVLSVNALIAGGVAATGQATYVDVTAGFAGHALCDTGDRWVSGLISSNARTTDRGFHPNSAGHAAYAAIIAEYVQ